MIKSASSETLYQKERPGQICSRMSTEPPAHKMASSSTARNAQISGVFFTARMVTNISAKQLRTATLI